MLRKRRNLNEQQKSVLERSLAISWYPNETTLNLLAMQTGLEIAAVSKWLKNKRRLAQRGEYKGTLCEYVANS